MSTTRVPHIQKFPPYKQKRDFFRENQNKKAVKRRKERNREIYRERYDRHTRKEFGNKT